MAAPVTVDPWHWLEADGTLPEAPRARGLALRVAQAIEYGGTLPRGHGRETLMPCRRRPGGVPCPGLMTVYMEEEGTIFLFCGRCDAQEYVIHNWENTPWADGHRKAARYEAVVDEAPASTAKKPEARSTSSTAPKAPEVNTPVDDHPLPSSEPDPRLKRIAAALREIGSDLAPAAVRDRIAVAERPMDVLQWILGSLTGRASHAAVEGFLPVFLALWNDTPRPDLEGRTPKEVARTPVTRPAKVGVNQPCPCGSGRKYKRCCMQREAVQ